MFSVAPGFAPGPSGWSGQPVGHSTLSAYYMGRPSIKAGHFDPSSDAEQLRKAMRGMGEIFSQLHSYLVSR